MDQLRDLAAELRIEPSALLDIFLTAVLIYLVLRLIQGTRAVRLAIGAAIVYGVYVVALELDLRLLSGILQTGAVVGLVALVVIFQPELRRGWTEFGVQRATLIERRLDIDDDRLRRNALAALARDFRTLSPELERLAASVS